MSPFKVTWTPAKKQLLRELAGTMDRQALAERLGVTVVALQVRASTDGIALIRRKRTRPIAFWTPERETQLRTLAGTMPRSDLADALGCSLTAASQYASEHGISLRFFKNGGQRRPRVAERVAAPQAASPSPPPVVPDTPPAAIRPPRQIAIAPPTMMPTREVAIVRPPNPMLGRGWLNLRHKSGKWLSLDGLSLVAERRDGYLCKREQLAAARRAFPLIAECEVVAAPEWKPRDGQKVMGL